MKEHGWCSAQELEDEAQQIFLKKCHEPDTAFQAYFCIIVESDFEAFREVDDGHTNQNCEPPKATTAFPEYLSTQVCLPYGSRFSDLKANSLLQ